MAAPTEGAVEAVAAVHKVSVDALGSIAKRLIRRLGESKQLLTEEEERQACTTLKLSTAELQALLEFSAYVFEQAAYQMQRPEQFEAHLAATYGVAPAHATALRHVWEAEATGYVNRLRDQHILGAKVLRDTTWTTHLCVAKSADASSATKKTESTAIFQFHFDEDQKASSSSSGGGDSSLAVECSHQELYGFFQKLQDIQRTIDNLSS
eukprot:CAMPEP_0198661514 /NCGR_PEP_ID=MMETSP1467-20131203/42274_1 /TAXON_ID=1462469 /ORGANISM="unid. sp., Strain CCMP2135" /LENGTH=208 /DNA_ID=CAMNT_0044397955 /DNA_START=45 /DNA_END=671 /DNA_ORIENTATION=-